MPNPLRFNEGKACDAVLQHLERRAGATRSAMRFPEKEGHPAPVELVCTIGGRLYAIEHTGIEPFEGHVREYLGDGIPVFFGFPIAHEDDTRRAILAARAIQDAIKRRNARLDVVQRPSRAQSWGEDVGRAG